jgi:hypothetical protein
LAGGLYSAFRFGIPAVDEYLQIRSEAMGSKPGRNIFEDRDGSGCFYKLYHDTYVKLDRETAYRWTEFNFSDDGLAACLYGKHYAQH